MNCQMSSTTSLSLFIIKMNYMKFHEFRPVFEKGYVCTHHTQSVKDLGHACKFSPCPIGSEAVFHLIPGHAGNSSN